MSIVTQRVWLCAAIVISASACGAADTAADRSETAREASGTVPPAMSGDGSFGGDTATGGDTGAGGSLGATGTDTSIRGARPFPIDTTRERER